MSFATLLESLTAEMAVAEITAPLTVWLEHRSGAAAYHELANRDKTTVNIEELNLHHLGR